MFGGLLRIAQPGRNAADFVRLSELTLVPAVIRVVSFETLALAALAVASVVLLGGLSAATLNAPIM